MNPDIIDLVTHNADTDQYKLIISKEGNWDESRLEFDALHEKISNYLNFIVGGQLVRDYPEAAGKPACIQLDYAVPPPPFILELLIACKQALAGHGIAFETQLLD